MVSFESIPFVCPLCHGALLHTKDSYRCIPCQRTYPIVLGIPDFRIFPDPYIGMEADWRKGERLMENARSRDFAGTVTSYYEMTPEVPPELAARYRRYVLAGVERGQTALAAMERYGGTDRTPTPRTLLEIGCGTGGLLLAASQRFEHIIGIDIAFRWLVVARKRFEEAEVNIPLVCGCAEYLPFSANAFDRIVAGDILEHSREQSRMLGEAARTLKRDGTFFLITPNRFSVRPEPCVQVWGVGYLPRRWMNTYVRWVRKVPYENVRLLSLFELRRMLAAAGFAGVRWVLPSLSASERGRFSRWERIQIGIYETLKRLPLLRYLLYLGGPTLWALGRKRAAREV